MKIGMIGAGRLGMPVALAFESVGHEVLVCDKADWVSEAIAMRHWPHMEAGVNDLLQESKIRNVSLKELVEHSEIVFVAVQTPHEEKYGGAVPLPEDRKDFDYTALANACRELDEEIKEKCGATLPWSKSFPPTVAVISTVLPGTMRREILPYYFKGVSFVYCPFFAAMGTVIEDVKNPEFVLLGAREPNSLYWCDLNKFQSAFKKLHNSERPFLWMSVESAELTKVAYNLFIGVKIVLANTVMEICHKIPGADCDDVMDALKLATSRIVSSKYMTSGMGDGGGCHPRDSIAMSYLAESLDLSNNIFDEVMLAREEQTSWLVDLLIAEADEANLPIVIMGKAYKPGTNLTDGSPGMLCAEMLRSYHGRECRHFDPYVDGRVPLEALIRPAAFLVATRHSQFQHYPFPPGSVVIDPFRYVPDREGVKVIRVGVGK